MDADCLCSAAPGFASYRTRIVRELEQPLRSALATRKDITPEYLESINAALPDIISGIQEKIHEWLSKRSKETPKSDVEETIHEATKEEVTKRTMHIPRETAKFSRYRPNVP